MEPLERLDDWDDFVAELYPTPVESGGKRREDYRDFEAPPRDTVREFYRLNHRHQTWDFVQDKKAEYLTLDRAELPVW
ncbi:MAG: inositol oxygenase, partial [Acidobacteriota bacterium]|nr:inositol oxygenase [Acidobacteriota bacterium]